MPNLIGIWRHTSVKRWHWCSGCTFDFVNNIIKNYFLISLKVAWNWIPLFHWFWWLESDFFKSHKLFATSGGFKRKQQAPWKNYHWWLEEVFALKLPAAVTETAFCKPLFNMHETFQHQVQRTTHLGPVRHLEKWQRWDSDIVQKATIFVKAVSSLYYHVNTA